MSKTFTCRELMGACDKKFSGRNFMEIAQKGMQHMQSADDEEHKKEMETNKANHKDGDREEWFAEMQQQFDSREQD